MSLTYPCFGLHFTDADIGLLLQEGRCEHALDVRQEFPATVKKAKRTLKCPHKINIGGRSINSPMYDPLFQTMLPLPKPPGSRPIYVEDTPENRELVLELLRLTSPVDEALSSTALWAIRPPELLPHLQMTNIQPLVVYDYHYSHHRRLLQIITASMGCPRRLLVLLPKFTLQMFGSETTSELRAIDVASYPLEMMGAGVLIDAMLTGKRHNEL